MAERQKFECEFTIRSSPSILFNFLTTPAGLVQWFADSVDYRDRDYVFTWEGVPEKAYLDEDIDGELVRYVFEDADDGEYLEFRISKAEITNDTILTIVDFAEEDEIEDQTRLWESQVDTLRTKLGG